MIFTSGTFKHASAGIVAALGMIAISALPANAHAARHHYYHGKSHVNVNVKIGGGSGHYYAYRPAPVVYVAPPKRRCTRLRRDGWYHGYPALVSNKVCFNAYGDAYEKPGTKRLVHYY